MIQVQHLPNLFPEDTILDNIQSHKFPWEYDNANFNFVSISDDYLDVGNRFEATKNIEKFILSKKINDTIIDVHLIGSKEDIKQGFLNPICININNLRIPQKKTVLCTKGICNVLYAKNLYYLAQTYLGKTLDIFAGCSDFDIEISYFVDFYKKINNLFKIYGIEQFFENVPSITDLILELKKNMDLIEANIISSEQTIYTLDNFINVFEPVILQKLKENNFIDLIATDDVVEIRKLGKYLALDKFEKINKNEFNIDLITNRLEFADEINCKIIPNCKLVETINSCPCTNLQLTYKIKNFNLCLVSEKLYPKYDKISKSYRNWLKYFLEPTLLLIGNYSFGEYFFYSIDRIEFIVKSDIAIITLSSKEGNIVHYFDMTYLRIVSSSISAISNDHF